MSEWAGERDPDVLHQFLNLMELENRRLHERLAQLVKEIASLTGRADSAQLALELHRLQEQLGRLQGQMFGHSSEKRPAPAASDDDQAEKPARRGHGPTPQQELPVARVEVELADDERGCAFCGGELQPIDGMTEDSERITVVRRQFVVEKIQRRKYRCQCGVGLVTAPAPVSHLPGGRYSLEFAAHVAEEKYALHLPLDRQRRAMERLGVQITTQTLWDQLDALAGHLEANYLALREFILGADVVGVDETWWRMMARRAGKRWWVWALTTPNAVWYGVAPSRSAATARSMLEGFEGTLVCDGYRAYQLLAQHDPSLDLAMCWAHARRKFIEAEPNYPQCAEALDLIGALFQLDRDTDDPALLVGDAKQAAAEDRLRVRGERAPVILQSLRDWALDQRGLPRSSLRTAIDYMLGHWQPLTTFVTDPFVPLDNNQSERALRGVVLGRNNHLGSRSPRGAHVTAMMYSLLGTALLNGIDPHRYLVNAVEQAITTPRAPPLLPL